MAKRVGLGKGLDALFQDNGEEESSVSMLKLTQLEPNKSQPRALFDDESLRELADSIREHGVIQPLVARPLEAGGYQIVAGERRWRASRMAGLKEVPVIIRELTDAQTLEIAIIENLQREDLNVVELALGYRALMDQYGMTQEQVAERLGKSRSAVANTVRLLALPEKVLEDVRRGRLSQGHAKALLSLEEPALILETAEQAAQGKLLVRDIEKLAKARREGSLPPQAAKEPAPSPAPLSTYYREMELALSQELGRKVRIVVQQGKKHLELEFYGDEELGELAAMLTGSRK